MKQKLITLIVFAVLLLLLAAAAIPMAGVTNFGSIHLSDTNGTATPNFLANQRGSGVIAEFRNNGTPVARIDASGLNVLGGLSIADRALFLRYQDVAAAPAIYAETAHLSATTSITTSILGIETPRNIVLTWVTVTTSTAGNVTVSGINAQGNTTTELIAVGAVNGSQTLTGAMPWASITSFTLPVRTETITLTVAGGQLFGLPLVPNVAGDLFHLTVNETPQANSTVNTTYGTFNPVSTPAADVDYNVWVKQ